MFPAAISPDESTINSGWTPGIQPDEIGALITAAIILQIIPSSASLEVLARPAEAIVVARSSEMEILKRTHILKL